MKIAFVSNYMTHHQKPFCDAMYRRLGGDFSFIAANKMEEERKNMGWSTEENKSEKIPYLSYYDDNAELANKVITEADFAINGGLHGVYIADRLKQKKPSFRYYERLYKTGTLRAYNPKTFLRNRREHTAYKNDPIYLLCAGGYVPYDFSIFGGYPNKMLKWGYFTAKEEESFSDILAKKEKHSILWTGRMLSWKHPEQVIFAALLLKGENLDFHLTMIGEGEARPLVESLIKENGLEDYVTLLPFMKPEEVRAYMKKSEIYLLTSDFEEGWGAVLNEAMSSGCAVVASHAAGATSYLLPEDGLKGFIYSSGEVGELASDIYDLLEKEEKRINMAERAYETMASLWSPEEAAERFLDFCDGLQKGEERFYSAGPMSRAEILKPKKQFRGMWEMTE